MKITVYTIGKTKDNDVLSLEKEYLKRLKKYCQYELIELSDCKISNGSEELVKATEAQTLLSKLEPTDFFIALDERGESFSSESFAEYLQEKMNKGVSNLKIAIGGALGFDQSVRDRANLILSLSEMTFPHKLIRVFVAEQIYRAFSILRGEPYHKA